MKDLTAHKVLKTTFEHLDTILDEKNRQIEKVSATSYKTAFPPNKMKQDTKKTKK